MKLTLTVISCLDSLPSIQAEDNPYQISAPLLAQTVYGNYITGYFRKDFQGIGQFQPISESRPYSVREVTWWCELPTDELYDSGDL